MTHNKKIGQSFRKFLHEFLICMNLFFQQRMTQFVENFVIFETYHSSDIL